MKTKKEKQVLKIPALPKQIIGDKEETKLCLRVSAYCRVSTEQESQVGSYARQIAYYEDKIKKRSDWILVGVYADEGTSGTVKKKRDGFLRLIQDCEDGKIDLILTKSISRFARNTVDLLTTIRQLKKKNIAVYFEKENINTMESTGELLITILSSQAQEEKLWRSYITRQLNGRVSQYSITGKLVCLECGNTYTRVTRKIDGNKYIVWRCKSHMLHGNTVCKKGHTLSEKNLYQAIWEAYSIMKQDTSDNQGIAEQKIITQKMLNHKRAIKKAIHENTQGFWKKEELISYYIKEMNEYYELAEKLCRLLLANDEDSWISSLFIPIRGYSNYKKCDNELISLYVERIWAITGNEIVVLFKNGNIVRRQWYY